MQKTPHYVLVVEDDYIVRVVHREMLLKLGYTVDIAVNGEAALTMTEASDKINHYNLILLDIGLPDISGIEIANRIHVKQHSARIVAVTAHKDAHLEAACLATRAIDTVIIKPINLDKLDAAIPSGERPTVPL